MSSADLTSPTTLSAALPALTSDQPERSPLLPGALGLVQAVRLIMDAVLARGDGPAMPEGVALPSWQELACISSAALVHYVYDPEINLAYDPPRVTSVYASLMSNWGVFEALAYETGWDIKELQGISEEDYWALLRFELSQGRPALTLGLDGPLAPTLVVGLEERPYERVAHVLRADGSTPLSDRAAEPVPMWGRQNAQGEDEVFLNWLVVVRPTLHPDWGSTSRRKRRLRLLRWVTQHARHVKEFFHETRENYAPGLRGFARAQALLASASLSPAELKRWASHTQQLAAGRHLASQELRRWALALEDDQGHDVAGGDDVELLDAAAARAQLERAADAYGVVAARLSAQDTSWVEAYALAAQAEREAIEALEAMLRVIKLGF